MKSQRIKNRITNVHSGGCKWSAMTALVVAFICAFFAMICIPSLSAEAKGTIYTGSVDYTSSAGELFNVGVYAGGFDGDMMGKYEITLKFDPDYIVLVEENGENDTGEYVIKGESLDGGRVRTMLTFRALMGGETVIEAVDGQIFSPAGDKLEMNPLPEVPVHLNAPAMTVPGFISINDEKIEDFKGDTTEYEFTIPYTEEFKISVPTDYKVACDKDTLSVGENTVSVLVMQEGFTPIEYTLKITMEEKPVSNEDDATGTDNPDSNAAEQPGENADNNDSNPQNDQGNSPVDFENNGKLSEEEELELIREALKQASIKEANPEIEALHLKDMKISDNNNQAELARQRKKSALILIGFVGLIVLIIIARLVFAWIVDNERGILRENKLISRFNARSQQELFSFADIESKKSSASAKYFERGLDEMVKDNSQKDVKNNAGKK